MHELEFRKATITIAGLRASDWFGDGSFYILDTPGHTIGHISALARTQQGDPTQNVPDTFMLLAGDVCNHMGELRPSQGQHIPEDLPIASKTPAGNSFASEYRHVHPHHCVDRPFYQPLSGGFNLDLILMQATLEKIAVLDNDRRVFTVLSHDNWTMDVVDLFPAKDNDWYAKGRLEHSR